MCVCGGGLVEGGGGGQGALCLRFYVHIFADLVKSGSPLLVRYNTTQMTAVIITVAVGVSFFYMYPFYV